MIICLPTVDRQVAFAFYRDGLGFEPFGDEIADDGVPEPLQFVVDEGLRIMLIPTGGFGWITGGRATAGSATSECALNLPAESDTHVDEIVARAVAAGAKTVTEPGQQPWGYSGAFTDPDGHVWLVTSGKFPN
ncbi:VOC family protein [Actinokineospora sp. HUAS TT18]|uniref:VOC family protein n=1 Tax=Actinokineospora sp. HUAS TT18 TaxID=3447451 RepID=UPI003F51E774